MTFISAWTQAPLMVVYKDSAGQEWVRKGGSRSWRNCNPGNISKGTFADACGAIGGDTRFAIFPDETSGLDAIVSLLKSASYHDLSIEQAIFRYAPPSENASTAYVAAMVAAIGVPASTIVGTLSAIQFQAFAAGIKKQEGWQAGQEYAQAPGGALQAGLALAQMAAPAQTVTIHSASPAGDHYEIRFDKTGANQGSIEVKSWNAGSNWTTANPDQDTKVPLTGIQVSADGAQIVCDGHIWGQTPRLTCSVSPAAGGAGATVSIQISNTLFGFADGTKTYPIDDADYQNLTRFVAGAGFPRGAVAGARVAEAAGEGPVGPAPAVPPRKLLTFAFDQGQMPTIACVNLASTALQVDWIALIAALGNYVDKCFSPVWGTPARIIDAGNGPIPSGCWGLAFMDDADQKNALGYHDLTEEGLPLSKIFVRDTLAAGEKVSVTASHEIAEMLVDPAVQLGAIGPDNSTWYAYETADAVEREEFDVDGIAMSNFVFPSWFEGFRAPHSTKFDYLGNCAQPFELRPGGYVNQYKSGEWTQIFGSEQAKSSFILRSHPRAAVRGVAMRHRSDVRSSACGTGDASARPTSAPTPEGPSN